MRWPNGSTTRPNISSHFGPRRAPVAGASTFHRGTDFTGIGQVRSIAAGRVVVVGTPSGWSAGGKQVWVQHDGFFTRSLHLGSYNVKVGQEIAEGTILGAQDTTGTASGSHLHLEVCLGTAFTSGATQIDPVPFIQGRLTTGSAAGGSALYGQWGGTDWIRAIQDKLRRLGYDITVDGQDGPQTQATVKDFQSKNGLTVDGIAGPATNAKLDERLAQGVGANQTTRPTSDIQRLVGAIVDGVWGPETTAKVIAWQAANGLTADGIWGPMSDAKGFPPTPAAFIPIEVDGNWGAATTRALQASLGFTGADIDGDRGPKTVKAQQIATGMPVELQDGIAGPTTTRYLQASLGVRQDGQEGPETVRALQSLLNRGGRLLPGSLDTVEPPAVHPKPESATYPGSTWWHHSPNSSKREDRVQFFVVHHAASTASVQSLRDRFMAPNDRSVSPNWLIGAAGEVEEIVPPDAWRAWTTGQFDHKAITVETQNTSGEPAWGISDASHEQIAKLVAWAAARYGFPIDRTHVIGHREVPGQATACPGPSMDLDRIVARAIELTVPPVDPTPTIKAVSLELIEEITTAHAKLTALIEKLGE